MYQVLMPPAGRALTSQSVAVTASSTAGGATFLAQTYMVRLQSNTTGFYKIGDGAQTATAAHNYLAQHVVEFVRVTPGQSIATLLASSGGQDSTAPSAGTLWVTEIGP